MALDKLVDSSQLDSDLTSVANAIRTKGGTSAQLAFPAGFAAAIQAIPTGGTPTGTKQISITANGTTTEDVAAYANAEITVNVQGGGGADPAYTFSPSSIQVIRLRKASDANEVTFDCTKFVNLTTLENLFLGSSSIPVPNRIIFTPPTANLETQAIFGSSASGGEGNLTEIVLTSTFFPRSKNGSAYGEFSGHKNLVTIQGAINLSRQTARANRFSATNYENMFGASSIASNLESVTFVPGTMSMTTTNWVLSGHSKLSDESLISIANSLKDTYSGTITFHATPKARLSTIMGTVTTTDGLSIFTKDAGGTVSLQAFLTTTKGATLA